MKKYLLLIVFCFPLLSLKSQSFSFGLEFMQRNNKLTGAPEIGIPNYKTGDFFVKDNLGDTLSVVFDSYTVSNNFELPLYMRYRFKNRWNIDLTFSSSKYNVNLTGTSNYLDGFYKKYFLSYPDYQTMVNNQWGGYQSDSASYLNYIESHRNFEQSDIEYVEKFKLTTIGLNVGYTFLPHKAIKPYVFSGFTLRKKSKQYSYDHINLRSDWVQDQQELTTGVVKFSDNSFQMRFGAGFETYKFRAGVSYDYNYSVSNSIAKNGTNVYRNNGNRPYDALTSVSFYISADLITKDFTTVKQSVSNSDIVGIEKLELKKSKNQFGFTISKLAGSKINDYNYANNSISFAKAGGHYWSDNYSLDSLSYRIKIQTITFKGISLVDFTPKIQGFYRRTFLDKFEWESGLSWQGLTVDMKTKELSSDIYFSQDFSEMYYDSKQTKLFTGVYRNKYNIVSFDQNINFQVIKNDFLKFKVSAGFSVNSFGKTTSGSKQKGVNELSLTNTLDKIYNKTSLGGDTTGLYILNKDLTINLSQSPSVLDSQIEVDKTYANWAKTAKLNNVLNSFRIGMEAEFDRILLGMNYEKTIGNGDGFIIKNVSRFYFSIGYVLFRR